MTDSIAYVKSIFGKALELETPEALAAYLDQACGSDPCLRAEVESLLHAHPAAAGFFAAVAPAPPPIPHHGVDQRPGAVVGPYKLIEQIAEGGMGTVWMAQQTEPVRRLVALRAVAGAQQQRGQLRAVPAAR